MVHGVAPSFFPPLKMKIGIVSRNNNFLGDIYPELVRYHSVRLYEETKDNSLNYWNLGRMCEWADLIWCEFAQPPFQFVLNIVPEKHIIVRLHRIELYNPYIYTLNWSAVNMLIFSAEHVKEIFYEKLKESKLPEGGLNIKNKPMADIVIPTNIINPKVFSFVQRDFKPPYKICMIGRVAEIKRVYDFIQWFKDVDNRFILNIGTQGINWNTDYSMDVKNLVEDDDRISFIPQFANAQAVATFMKSQDIIVSHSRNEGSHVSIMEAMATGCYPLISNWKGAEVVYPPENIYHSPNEFFDKINSWADSDNIQKLHASIEAYEYTKPYISLDAAIRIRELVEAVHTRDNIATYYDTLVPHMIEQKDNKRNKDALHFLDKWVKPEIKVLDLGCGIGTASNHIHTHIGADVIGLDLSPDAIAYARKHFHANFRCGSIFFEHFYHKFDCIVMADVLEHVKLDQHPKLFKLLNNLTTDKGMLLINIPHPMYMKELWKKYPFGNLKIFQPVDEVVEIEPLLIQLKEAGFSDVKYSESVLDNQYYKIVVRKGGQKDKEVEGREK